MKTIDVTQLPPKEKLPKDIEKRQGILKISDVLIQKEYGFLIDLFWWLQFFPLDTKWDVNLLDVYEVKGTSPFFDVCEENDDVPQYMLVLETFDGKITRLQVERC